MKKVYLHIGMHKTGTTAIQMALNGMVHEAAKYAQLSHANHSVPLMTIFQKHPYYHWKQFNTSEEQVKQYGVEFLSDLKAEISCSEEQALVLSAEDVSLLANDDKRKLVAFFRDFGVDLNVVCLLRDPVSYVGSALQQRIKGGLVQLTEISPRYERRLRYFKQAIDPQKFMVRDYAAVCSEAGDVVRGFIGLLDLPFEVEPGPKRNKSFSILGTRIVYMLNQIFDYSKLTKEQNFARRRLLQCINKLTRNDVSDSAPNWDIASILFPEDIYEELAYVSEAFGIEYSLTRQRGSYDDVYDFLKLPDSFDAVSLCSGINSHFAFEFSETDCESLLRLSMEKLTNEEQTKQQA